jgi:starch synthase
MIAMRYGCVPVARAVGGLVDTIQDFDRSVESTGFLFGEATSEALASALRRMLQVFTDPQAWQGLQRRGMWKDFSWERSAREYERLYRALVVS